MTEYILTDAQQVNDHEVEIEVDDGTNYKWVTITGTQYFELRQRGYIRLEDGFVRMK